VAGSCHAAPHPADGRVRSENLPSRKSLWPIRPWLLMGSLQQFQPIHKPVGLRERRARGIDGQRAEARNSPTALGTARCSGCRP
jgi:hypothetical protein